MSELLFVVSAPSGAGKTSLVAALLEADPHLTVSISHTTRPRRPAETDGVNYHFTDQATFDAMVANGEFLEHAQVFGHSYGTTKAAVAKEHTTGSDVILEIDWQGAAQIRDSFAQAISIFILPPSLAALRERLVGRAQDAEKVIAKRLAEARTELSHAHEFTHIVINDDFTAALAELQAIVTAEREGRRIHTSRHAALIGDLLKGT